LLDEAVFLFARFEVFSRKGRDGGQRFSEIKKESRKRLSFFIFKVSLEIK